MNGRGSKIMAAARKSAQQLAAREKAREQAKVLTDRHERLIDLAAEFFEHEERAEQIHAEARERADAILDKAEQDAAAASKDAGAKVRDMLDTGESRAAVAARLGLSAAEVKRHADAGTGVGGAQRPTDADAPAAGERSSERSAETSAADRKNASDSQQSAA